MSDVGVSGCLDDLWGSEDNVIEAQMHFCCEEQMEAPWPEGCSWLYWATMLPRELEHADSLIT